MKWLLGLSAVGEAAFGVVLFMHPPIVVRLLFNAQIADVGTVMSRVAGIVLIALGLACLPGRNSGNSQVRGMLCYSLLVTLYLIYQGIRGEWVGSLLWPAVAMHAILTLLLARSWWRTE